MARALWEGVILAESDNCVVVEGNQYFPAESVKREYLRDSKETTRCPWKGTANYYDVVVDGKINTNAAWYYAHPSPAAAQIKDRVAFWKGVQVEI